MLRVMPPTRETVKSTAELALKYLEEPEPNLALVKEVIRNVIKGLDCEDFDKPDWSDSDADTWTTFTKGSEVRVMVDQCPSLFETSEGGPMPESTRTDDGKTPFNITSKLKLVHNVL